MTHVSTYPDTAGFKRDGTSREAAEGIEGSGKAAVIREKVRKIYRECFIGTADEAAAFLGENILSVRPRVSEFVKKDLLRDTGLRRPSANGRSATVWKWWTF